MIFDIEINTTWSDETLERTWRDRPVAEYDDEEDEIFDDDDMFDDDDDDLFEDEDDFDSDYDDDEDYDEDFDLDDEDFD